MFKSLQSQRLFNLLAIALTGQKQIISLFEGMTAKNWQELMTLCTRQGVLAVCFEAIEKCTTRPPMKELMDWLGQTNYLESQYDNHLALAKELCAKWAEVGVPTMVFKGLAHSRYYPVPAHREFGDFDCYQFGRIADGNKVAAEIGAKVDDDWYKHSKIQYKQLTIENHRYFSAVRSNRHAKALNEYMVGVLGDGSYLLRLDDTNILLPTIEVEGLFMLHHSMRHFLEEGITVRHFCDWACWLMTNENRIIWNDFYGKCREFGLDGFVDVMNNIVKRYLCLNIDINLNCSENGIADKVVKDTLYDDATIHNKGNSRWFERVHLFTNAFRYSWKYRDVAHYNMIGYLWGYVMGFIFREEHRNHLNDSSQY